MSASPGPDRARRLNTACFNEFTIKWTKQANPRGTYRFINQSTDAKPIWVSPRGTGLLHEVKGAPEHYTRDTVMLNNARDILAGVKSGANPKPRRPFGLNSGFFTRRMGNFETFGKRESVTRHQWGVLEFPAHAVQPSATPVAMQRVRASSVEPLPSERFWHKNRTTYGSQVPSFGSPLSTSRMLAASGSALPTDRSAKGANAAAASFARTASEKLAEAEAIQVLVEQRKAAERERRQLTKQMRSAMKEHLKDTHSLPMNLWAAFKKTDMDHSGRIEFEEFVNVCEDIGLKREVLGEHGQRHIFEMCDKDGGGAIDFNEFLNTLVGNLVKL